MCTCQVQVSTIYNPSDWPGQSVQKSLSESFASVRLDVERKPKLTLEQQLAVRRQELAALKQQREAAMQQAAAAEQQQPTPVENDMEKKSGRPGLS